MREKLFNVAVGMMALCAVGTTALTTWRAFVPPSPPSQPEPRIQRDWARYAREGHVLGSQTARVTVVEFADFECPYCASVKPTLDTLLARHPQDVRILFRHFPLASHHLALQAAKAAECASEQGRFAPMYDVLFANRDSMGIVPWGWFGHAAGVASDEGFTQCLQSGKSFAAIARDTAAGGELGVTGTPTLLVNNLRLDGIITLDSLEAYVARAIPAATVRH